MRTRSCRQPGFEPAGLPAAATQGATLAEVAERHRPTWRPPRTRPYAHEGPHLAGTCAALAQAAAAPCAAALARRRPRVRGGSAHGAGGRAQGSGGAQGRGGEVQLAPRFDATSIWRVDNGDDR